MHSSLLVLLLASPPSTAVTIDRDQVAQMVRDQMPWVEQTAGRSFVKEPPVHIVRRAKLLAQRDAELAEGIAAGVGEVVAQQLERNRDLVEHALAMYDHSDETLYLLREGVEGSNTRARHPSCSSPWCAAWSPMSWSTPCKTRTPDCIDPGPSPSSSVAWR